MDYLKLTRTQRFNLRKKGHDIPLIRPGKKSIVGYDTKAKMKCSGCKTVFIGVKDPKSKKNYCSSLCYKENIKGSNNPNFKGGFIKKKCKGCCKKFNQKLSKYQSPYCSLECRIKSIEERRITVLIRKRIKDNVRKSILSYITRGTKENKKWQDLLGYSTKQLCDHLQSKFDSNMSWDNYGSYWHIDHIEPVSWFKFTTPNCVAFKKCWALKNLQPLEAKQNIKKGNKLCLK